MKRKIMAIALTAVVLSCDSPKATSVVKVDNQRMSASYTTEQQFTEIERTKYKCEWLGCELTKEEYKLLCTLVFCESGNQDTETQYMVALTVLNRLNSKLFPNSVREVIYAPYAYEVTTWSGFENYGYTEQVEQAVKMALLENRYSNQMYYFRTEYYHGFGVPYLKSGDLYFSTEN